MKMFRLLVIFTCLLLAGGVSAQNYVLWSGGVGEDEREQAPQEGTKLVFTVQSGSFLSGVKVQIKNMQGRELVNTTTKGPWLVLDLPPGQYSVQAMLESGEAQGAVINVDGKSAEFELTFRD